jgi:hypothetical protein
VHSQSLFSLHLSGIVRGAFRIVNIFLIAEIIIFFPLRRTSPPAILRLGEPENVLPNSFR